MVIESVQSLLPSTGLVFVFFNWKPRFPQDESEIAVVTDFTAHESLKNDCFINSTLFVLQKCQIQVNTEGKGSMAVVEFFYTLRRVDYIVCILKKSNQN